MKTTLGRPTAHSKQAYDRSTSFNTPNILGHCVEDLAMLTKTIFTEGVFHPASYVQFHS